MKKNRWAQEKSETGKRTGARNGRILGMLGKLIGVVLLAALLSSCSGIPGAESNAVIKGQDLSADLLVGDWYNANRYGENLTTITLNPDGTGKITEESQENEEKEYELEWTFQDGKLELNVRRTIDLFICYYSNGKLFFYQDDYQGMYIKKDQKETRTHTVSEEERKILGSWQLDGEWKEAHRAYTFFEDGMYSLKTWGDDAAKVTYHDPCDWFIIDNCLVLQGNPKYQHGRFTWIKFDIESITSHHISIRDWGTMTRID